MAAWHTPKKHIMYFNGAFAKIIGRAKAPIKYYKNTIFSGAFLRE